MRSLLHPVWMALAVGLWFAAAQVQGIGRVPSSAEIAARDLTVFPDGTGLPVGRGTARSGRALYETHCAACHGLRGEGKPYFAALAGGRGSLSSSQPLLTVGSYWPYASTLWDYTRRAMPYANPGALSADEVYSVVAYILHLSDIVGLDEVLDRHSLPLVKMPNRDGFVPDTRPDVPVRP